MSSFSKLFGVYRLIKKSNAIRFSTNATKNVYIETYGCQMNFSDSEIALSILESAGYKRVKDISTAHVALIMTCAIRDSAEEKIRNRIKMIRRSRVHIQAGLKLGILGCMAERLKARLLEDARLSVDVVCGPDAYRDLPRLLEEAEAGAKGMNVALSLEETYADVKPVRLSGAGVPSAFVSVMRGCDNMCTYCIVPFTRGRERSRPIESVVGEVQRLVDQGVREVVLLGQNVNSYRDTSQGCSGEVVSVVPGFNTVYKAKRGGRPFVKLLAAVSDVCPELRVRFTSPHPKDFPREVLELIKERSNIATQLHLPAQSGSSDVLARMGRGYSREAYLDLVDNVRDLIPDVGISSDFIAGFCGESEAEHEETLSLLRKVKYNFVFCFPYSMREKTRAYHRLEDDVSQEVKKRRHRELADEFRRQAFIVNETMIDSVQLVLLDGDSKRSGNQWAGRNEANTKVIFPKVRSLPLDTSLCGEEVAVDVGDYVAVKITGATSQSLRGEPICRTKIVTFNPARIQQQFCTRQIDQAIYN